MVELLKKEQPNQDQIVFCGTSKTKTRILNSIVESRIVCAADT